VSCNASGRANTKEIGIFFYDLNKIMKIKKDKSKEKETKNDVPSAFFFFCLPL